MTREKDGLVLSLQKSPNGNELKSARLDNLKDVQGEQILKMSSDIRDQYIQVGENLIPFDIYI